MANDQILIELQIIQKGGKLAVVAKDTEKLAKAQDKQAKTGKKVAKNSEEVIKGQKGIHQTGLSSSKGFSKMNQMLNGGGGSSGLVAAYATLAANVFAATAAFNAFRQAAAFEQLAAGFTFLANESGRTMSLVVDRLKDVTDGALSTQEALQGASLAVSGGFSIETLEKLAKVAKGASLALGRNLNDAFDRLTRGAIKLEPEILDELGIMVRLDDATTKYAATIGKTRDELTQFERQTAFINAINEQGIAKYGELADAVDVNPYDQLAASFGDLSKEFLSLINVALIPIIEFFSNSKEGLIAVTVLFASTIVTTMIPALGQMVQRSQSAAKAQLMLAKSTKATTNLQVVAAMKTINSNKKTTKTVRDLARAVQDGSGIKKQAAITEKNLNLQLIRAEKARNAAQAAGDKKRFVAKEARIAQIKREIADTKILAVTETAQLTAGLALDRARVLAKTSMIVAKNLEIIAGVGMLGGFKQAAKGVKLLAGMLFGAGLAGKKSSASMSLFARVTTLAGGSMKLFGAAFLTALPAIAAIGIAIAGAIYVFKKLTGPLHANSEGIKQLATVTETVTEKFEQLNKAVEENSLTKGGIRIRQYKMTAGIFQEIAAGIRQINKEIEIQNKTPMPVLGEGEFKLDNSPRGAAANADTKTRFQAELKLRQALSKEGVDGVKESLTAIVNETGVAAELAKIKLKKAFGPEAVNTAGGLQQFIKELDKGTAGETLDFLLATMTNLEKGTSQTSSSIINLTRALSEGEKNLAAFTEKATKKTEFDDIVKTFQGFKNELKALGEDDDAAGVIEEIFKGAGAQAKMFGITSENAVTRVNELFTAFSNIQKKAVTLQDDLKTLNSAMKKLGTVKNTSGMGTEAFLEAQEKSINLQLQFNKDQVDEVNKLTDSAGKLKLLAELTAERTQLTSKLLTDMQKILTVQETELKIQSATLNTNIKMQESAAEVLKIEQQLQNLREGRGSKLSPLQEYKAKVQASQDELTNERKKQKIADLSAANRFNTTLENSKALKDGTEIEKQQYAAIVIEAAKKYELDLKANKANVTAQERILSLVQQQGTESESMVVAATALLSAMGAGTDTLGLKFTILSTQMQPFIDQLKQLGTEGNLAGIAIEKLMTLGNHITNFGTSVKDLAAEFEVTRSQKGDTFLDGILGTANPDTIATTIAGLQTMGAAFGAMGSIIEQEAAQRTAAIDKAIAQEKRLGGNSAASIKKIEQMESKKEAIKRKAFEKQKKMQIAETIMNTAASAMTALTTFAAVPPLAIAMAGMITAIGLKQVSIIRSQQYEGSGTAPSAPSSISVGKRDNKVDVSKGATMGETAYLRGQTGTGNTANNFVPGGAGGMKRGYASGGEILVGERGPEVIRPTAEGYNVIPNDKLGGTSNVNFTINAVDAAGVQDLLMSQRGNIIGMIREAAHEHGEEFMEPVNTEAY